MIKNHAFLPKNTKDLRITLSRAHMGYTGFLVLLPRRHLIFGNERFRTQGSVTHGGKPVEKSITLFVGRTCGARVYLTKRCKTLVRQPRIPTHRTTQIKQRDTVPVAHNCFARFNGLAEDSFKSNWHTKSTKFCGTSCKSPPVLPIVYIRTHGTGVRSAGVFVARLKELPYFDDRSIRNHTPHAQIKANNVRNVSQKDRFS